MAEMQPTGKTVMGLLRRRRAWILATVAAVLGIANLVVLLKPPSYEASALLVIDQRSTSPSADLNATISTGQLLAAHYIKMATSSTVLDRVCADATGDCSSDSLRKHVNAVTVKGTDLMAVKVTDANSGPAANLANLVAAKLIDEQHREVAGALKPTKVYLDGELDRLSREIAAAKPPALAALQAQYTTVFNRREAVAEQESRLDGSLSLIQAAAAPAKPADPDLLVYFMAALAVGSVAALIIALVVDRVDTRIFSREALADATAAPLVVRC